MALAPSIIINMPGVPFQNLTSASNIAALRALPSTAFVNGQDIVVDGSLALGDGGGGLYVWDTLSTANDDGVLFIKPTDVPALSAGRWRPTSVTSLIKPTGEATTIALASAIRPFAQGPRNALIYNGANSVRFTANNVVMGGFRFRGASTRGRGPVVAMPASKVALYTTAGCPVLSVIKTETWVAAFACSNLGDAVATIRTMPFLRLAERVGSTANIIRGGENVHNLVTTASYSWAAANNLAGTECLVISEGGGFSGRTTTITANTNTSVTLATIGTISAGDFILPAPPGFTDYQYLGSFYFDTAEVRNIYDSGVEAMGKMIFITTDKAGGTTFLTGSVPAAIEIDARGYICPLATAVIMDSSLILSTVSTGDYAEYFGGDTSNHTVRTFYDFKDGATSRTMVNVGVVVPFLYHQTFAFSNAGSLAASRTTGQLNVTGWIEP